MAKIAGYILDQFIDQGDEWLNAVDRKMTGPFAMHRQCAWNDEALRSGSDAEIISMVSLEEADKHICSLCREKLSSPAYFHFEEEYKRRHETIGWIRVISHEEMYSSDGYRDVVDKILLVCRDCEPERPYDYECLERMETRDSYRCDSCNKPMRMAGWKATKEAKNGACDLIQLFDCSDQFAPGCYIAVVRSSKYQKIIYELHELADAEALYSALLKVSA